MYVHFSEILDRSNRTLEEGERVEFEVGQGTKGPTASGVTRIS